tara:strand:+ start:234 stop:416 length:183 start_codon:yes stop_codon:yes gene_type:complete
VEVEVEFRLLLVRICQEVAAVEEEELELLVIYLVQLILEVAVEDMAQTVRLVEQQGVQVL